MTLATETPAVLIVSATELNGHTGKLLRHLSSGCVVRIDNLALGETVGWLSADPPRSLNGCLSQLPAPGSTADRIGDADVC
jgi:hypothetical protein